MSIKERLTISRVSFIEKSEIKDSYTQACYRCLYLSRRFVTPRQRNKARLILSGVFATAGRKGWCAENPVRKVLPERIEEKRIELATWPWRASTAEVNPSW